MLNTNSITHHTGFTLVEAIVTSTLLGIMAIIVYTVFQMNSAQAKDTTLVARLQGQYEGIVSQIGAKARASNVVLKTSETWPPLNLLIDSTTEIYMRDGAGQITAGFKLNGSTIQEYVVGTSLWQNVVIGGRTVRSTGGYPFKLSQNRKILTMDLAVVDTFQRLVDTMPSRREAFQCRN